MAAAPVPTRRRAGWWSAGLVSLLAAAGLLGADAGPRQPADALVATGMMNGNEVGFTAPRAGKLYDFGFSPLMNTTSKPVTVLGFRVRETSRYVHALGYGLYSAQQLGGVYLGHQEGAHDVGVDLDHAPQAHLPYTIAPHTESDMYAVVRVILTAFPPPGYVKGCEEIYRVGSDPTAYVQRFDCTYYFGEHASDYFDGRATLRLGNSYAHDITIYGCPGCSSRGVKIGGLPGQSEGQGGGVGWDLDKSDSRRLDVLVGGRKVQCIPPTGSAAVRYAALHGPDLYYNITPKGTCIVLP